MESTSVRRLVRRCALDSDERGWEELVHRYGRRLEHRVRRTLVRSGRRPRPEDVEELVQEVYFRLLAGRARRLRRFRGTSDGELLAFLGRVVRSVVLDHLRAAGAAKRTAERRPLRPSLRHPSTMEPADCGLSAEQRLLLREHRAALLARVQKLAGGRRRERNLEILRLALVDGWSSREISRLLAGRLTPSGVDSVVHRARRLLAEEGITVPAR